MAGRDTSGATQDDRPLWPEADADDCLTAIGVQSGLTVLDFGCAEGAYSLPAARLVGEQGKVYALDKNAQALNALRRLASDQGLAHIDTVNTHGDVRVPLEDESVDIVFLHDILHLIGWEESGGQTTRRSTAGDRRALLDEAYRVMKSDGVASVFGPHLVTHTDILSEDDLNREIESAGFRLQKEMYHQLMHDGHLEQGHLYSYRKRQPSEPAPETFVYDSPSFQTQLRQDAHHYGEVTLLEAMAEPGMVVLELGANRGVTTVALAKRVGPHGQVHAFEPVPEYYAALTQNLRLNEADNVRIHQLAVVDKEDEISYYKHGEGSGIVQADEAEEIRVGVTSLDYFVGDQALDREGAELLVLQAGKETLERHAPLVLCEIHHDYLSRLGQSVQDIVAYLRALGYQVAPVRVEALDRKVEAKDCSHICAAANGHLPDLGRIAGRQQKE